MTSTTNDLPKTTIAACAAHILSQDPTSPYRLISRDEARARLDDADRAAFDRACQERDTTIRQKIIDYGKASNLDPIPSGQAIALATATDLTSKGWHCGAIELIVSDIATAAMKLQQDYNLALETIADGS